MVVTEIDSNYHTGKKNTQKCLGGLLGVQVTVARYMKTLVKL